MSKLDTVDERASLEDTLESLSKFPLSCHARRIMIGFELVLLIRSASCDPWRVRSMPPSRKGAKTTHLFVRVE